MNYVFLNDVGLYLCIAIMALMLLVSIFCLVCAIVTDRRNYMLADLLSEEKEKKMQLKKENFVLRLKYGELNSDE